MKLDRAEWTGAGAALAFHVVLIGALSLSLAHVAPVPEPPAMEVEFADEVALDSAAPAETPSPAPAMQAPEVGPPEPIESPPPAPTPVPAPAPAPPPRPVQRVQPSPPRSAAPKPAPAKPAPPTAKPQARPGAQPRAPRLGSDFLKGVSDDLAPKGNTGRPAAATVSASAMAGIVSAIRRQVQPCADRQVNPGPGASRIKVRMRLQLFPNGRLKRPPMVLGTSGVDGDNAQYEERVVDLAVAAFTGCAPMRGLPPELYETESGRGWSDFIMIYNLPS
nr:cell envelope biogenesis protein TolA [uncultured Sphingomonas sp.]